MNYLVLNVVFMVVIFITLLLTGQLQKVRRRPLLITLAIMVLATAVFDSLIVGLGLVTYDTTKILGIYMGKAPIEDFAYTLAVVLLVPVVWNIMGRSNEK